MEELSIKKMNEIVDRYIEGINEGQTHTVIKEKLQNELDKYYSQKAVLGIDIYRYSQFQKLEQTFIPYIFKTILDATTDICFKYEPFIFQKTSKDTIINSFIDTGDGGFLIFDTPLEAVTYAIYFESNLKRFNSKLSSLGKAKSIVGSLSLRYSLTYDYIYFSNKNHYGASIINNARIMSKDKLNRFLLDSNSINWFEEELNGIENLQRISIMEDYTDIKIFKNYNKTKTKDKDAKYIETLLFKKNSGIVTSDIMHIGEIKAKLDKLDIYSSHIQANLTSGKKTGFTKFVVSLGNLNSTGITD